MLEIDGSLGEGGGQVLRTALSLSLLSGIPFRLTNIRARRPRPGLARQHLTAVLAAAEVGHARVEGAALRSRELVFVPGTVTGGDYHFDVGTAGSTTLVLQTVIYPLMFAGERSRVVLQGGTHNTHAPPYDFLEGAYLRALRGMGVDVTATLDRPGFAPAGGGRVVAEIDSVTKLRPLVLLERGKVESVRAVAWLSRLPDHIAERELEVVKKQLGWHRRDTEIRRVEAAGPGNVLSLEIRSEFATEVVTGFGEPGVLAERVAQRAVRAVRAYLDARVPVGDHLADQLLVPSALAGEGRFLTQGVTQHTRTNLDVIRAFLAVEGGFQEGSSGCVVNVSGPGYGAPGFARAQ